MYGVLVEAAREAGGYVLASDVIIAAAPAGPPVRRGRRVESPGGRRPARAAVAAVAGRSRWNIAAGAWP